MPWLAGTGEEILEARTTQLEFFALTNIRYGFHVPRTNARDNFYAKLEQKRASENTTQ